MSRGEVVAYVDESLRGNRYLIACAFIATRNAAEIRADLRNLVQRGDKIHFRQENHQHRRLVLKIISTFPIHVLVIECKMSNGRNARRARALCVQQLVKRIQKRNLASRLILENFSGYKQDIRTIQSVRTNSSVLNFEHRDSYECPELWIADAVAWTFGADQIWRRLLKQIEITHLEVE